jgi:hypothetical protein
MTSIVTGKRGDQYLVDLDRHPTYALAGLIN